MLYLGGGGRVLCGSCAVVCGTGKLELISKVLPSVWPHYRTACVRWEERCGVE